LSEQEYAPGDILDAAFYDSVTFVAQVPTAVEALHPVEGKVVVSSSASLLVPTRAASKIPADWPVVERAVPGVAIWPHLGREDLRAAALRHFSTTFRRRDIAFFAAGLRLFEPSKPLSLEPVIHARRLSASSLSDHQAVEFTRILGRQIAGGDRLLEANGYSKLTPRYIIDLADRIVNEIAVPHNIEATVGFADAARP
jgi:hypothetical protein